MKVGDLVELSAKGETLKWAKCYRGKLAFVMQGVNASGNIFLLFFRSDGSQMRRVLPRNLFRVAKIK
jgi:hypothetical protein